MLRVADYLDADCLRPDLRLTRMYLHARPEETISLLVPTVESRPAEHWPVLRYVTWDRRGDMRRRRELRWPTLTKDYFQVEPGDYARLDATLRHVDECLPSIALESRGLDIGYLYEEPPEIEIGTPNHDYDSLLCRRLKRRLGDVYFDLKLYGGAAALADACDSLWLTLRSLCRPPRRVTGWKEYYSLDLEQYADFLGRPRLDDL